MEHYLCYKIFIPSSGGVCIAGTLRWLPHGSLNLPIPSEDDILLSAIDDLHITLQLYVKTKSYHLKEPHPEKTCLTLMTSPIIATHVILLTNLQRLTTFQR